MKISKNGFSLIEVSISLAILSGIVLVTMNVSQKITKEIVNVSERSDVVLDYSGVFKVVNDDILNSAPSFNYLNTSKFQKDSFWTLWEKDDGPRAVEIKNDKECLSLLAIDVTNTFDINTGTLSRVQTLLPNPAYFYKSRTSMTAPLAYDSAKLKDLLKDNKLSSSNQLLKLSALMPEYDPVGFYKDYGMILKMDNKGNPISNTTSVPVYPPPTSCAATTTSIDNFIRCLPAQGGGVSNFYITPVNYITYCLKKVPNLKGFGLYRKRDSLESLIATNFKSIKLSRNKSSNPLVNIEINFCAIGDLASTCKN